MSGITNSIGWFDLSKTLDTSTLDSLKKVSDQDLRTLEQRLFHWQQIARRELEQRLADAALECTKS